ncbi:MAG: DNA (cytosine-5-)-methyltransferase [Methanomethylophilus sp.]|jgi:DNA (cytosine-5)-methyltransferase 1
MAKDIRVVELFAGVGGFRVGLEDASKRFKTVWADQWEPGSKTQFAFECYDRRFAGTDSVNVNEDINKVQDEVPEHDLLVGGFPCQDYSVAATKARGIQGKKGVLWWNIDHIIGNLHPKYVLLENVDRLLRSPVNQRGRDFAIILRCLADKGYYVEWRVINAADYGFQQRRRRTFIFACRRNQRFAEDRMMEGAGGIIDKTGFFATKFPIEHDASDLPYSRFSLSPRYFKDLTNISNEFTGHFYHAGVMQGYEVQTRDYVPVYEECRYPLGKMLDPDVPERYYIKDEDLPKWEYMKGAKKVPRKHSDGSDYLYTEGAIPYPDILDRAARTMLTSEGTKNRSSHIVPDPKTQRLRIITPEEAERINGFPPGWTDTGMSERQRYFCMGNALVVPLITRMGERILEIEDGKGRRRGAS